jgi:hypothetical protein
VLVIFAGLMMVVLLAALDQTIVATRSRRSLGISAVSVVSRG